MSQFPPGPEGGEQARLPPWPPVDLLPTGPPSTVDAAHVFISYRSGDVAAEAVAPRLAGRLKRDLGEQRVYFAPTDNVDGEDFEQRMGHAIAQATLVIVLMGPAWESGGTGGNRFEQPGDWVRRELATALAGDGRPLQLLLVDRERTPPPAQLPPDIRRVGTTHTSFVSFDLDRDYPGVLVRAWAEFAGAHPGVTLAVSDASDEGEALVEAAVAALEDAGVVDVERMRLLSRTLTSPPGTTVIPLREVAEDFPRVIVLTPTSVGERLARRQEALEEYVRDHARELVVATEVATVVSLLGVGATTAGSTTAGGGLSAAISGLSTSAKVGLALGAGLIGLAGVAVALPDPVPVVVLGEEGWVLEVTGAEPSGTWRAVNELVSRADSLVEYSQGEASSGDPYVLDYASNACTEPGCDLLFWDSWQTPQRLDDEQLEQARDLGFVLTSSDGGRTYSTGVVDLYELELSENPDDYIVSCGGDPTITRPALEALPEDLTASLDLRIRSASTIDVTGRMTIAGRSCGDASLEVTAVARRPVP